MKSDRVLVSVICSIPFLWIVFKGFTGLFSANPIEEIINNTGWWSLVFILVTLSMGFFQQLIGSGKLLIYRRIIGLTAFTYAFLHFVAWVALDQFFHWELIFQEILNRMYIFLGMVSFLMLLPLAITSTDYFVSALGFPNWKRLHYLAYIAALLAVCHFWLVSKRDPTEAKIFAIFAIFLLAYRIFWAFRASK